MYKTTASSFLCGIIVLAGISAIAQSPGNNTVASPTGVNDRAARPLSGLRICLDPGHGGNETGAVGKQGTKEKDVNLKVALLLRDMLADAGADIVLTRTGDQTVSIGDRYRINKAHDTDLFVSIHHNANAQGDDSMNRIEVFWHWRDDGGPSEDLARLLLREFQSASGRPGKAYMCWAYGVLRENAYPAVLGEFSYLQNPEEEVRLNDDSYLRNQARAYYCAIVKFFESGRPKITLISPTPITTRTVTATIATQQGRALTDPQTISATLNGKPERHIRFDPQTGLLQVTLTSASHSTQTLRLSVRNLEGRYSDVVVAPVVLAEAPRFSEIRSPYLTGFFAGKTIVIDPAGGGDDSVAVAPNGLRAADVNLRTALYLADYLRRSGARVVMTRERDESRDNVARVRVGLENNPDVFLTIGYRLPEPGMGEQPGQNRTRVGHRWEDGGTVALPLALRLREFLGTGDWTSSETVRKEDVHNWSSWEVMHGAQRYTAVHVSPLMFDGPGAAQRLSGSAGTRKAALAILYGLAEYFDPDAGGMGRIDGQVVDAATGQPVENALVWLEEFPVQTETDGCFAFLFLDQNVQYNLLIQADGYRTKLQTVTIRSDKPVRVTVGLDKIN